LEILSLLATIIMGYQPSPAQRQIAPPAAVWRSMNIGLGLGVVRFCACGREGFGQCDAQRDTQRIDRA